MILFPGTQNKHDLKPCHAKNTSIDYDSEPWHAKEIVFTMILNPQFADAAIHFIRALAHK